MEIGFRSPRDLVYFIKARQKRVALEQKWMKENAEIVSLVNFAIIFLNVFDYSSSGTVEGMKI